MPLYLAETAVDTPGREAVEALLAQLAGAAAATGGGLLDAQVSEDLAQLFVVLEHADVTTARRVLTAAGIHAAEPAEVRLVGATVDEVRDRAGGGGYLVEWDLPTGLTMDAYLARKKEKSPLYAEVPEVTFLRTYVREDLGKCLCFCDAPDEDAVCRAREVVGAPVDRLHRLAEQARAAT